jgi:hypothetical protein
MDPELMNAVNAGIAQANGTSTPTPAAGDDDASDHSASADDSEIRAGEGGATDEGDDRSTSDGRDGESEGGEAADSAVDGTVAAEGDDAASEDDAGGAAAPGAAKAPGSKGAAGAKPGEAGSGKAPDPLNDPLPNALKKETKERVQTLVGMVKDTTTKLERVTAERDEMMGYIRETQATPEQYGQALTYLKLVNSPNREDKEQALEIMQAEVAALARMIGKPVPGVNILEGHDDLIADVAAQRMSMERAAELAAAREAQNFQRRQGETARQQSQAQLAANQAKETARTQLNALEQSLMANDPTYKQKRPILVAQLRPIFAQLHPSRWPAAFKHAYDAMPAPAAPRTTTGAPNVPRNTPLRAGNPAGGSVPAPKNMLEAIELGLKNAR